MASIYGYMVMIMGLSILLGMAGADTTVGNTLASFTNMSIGSNSPSNVVISNLNLWDIIKNVFLNSFIGVLGSLLGLGVAAALRFGLGDTVKLGITGFITGVYIMDIVGIINMALNTTGMGTAVYWAVAVIYIPLGAAFAVAIANWIGGNS